MAIGNVVFDLFHLVPVSGSDVQASQTLPKFAPGAYAFMRDQAGVRYLKYVRNNTTSTFALGAVLSKYGDNHGNTAITNITSGSTVHFITTGLTADYHEGALMYVQDNDDAAGAAPEGEISPVVHNTATRVDLDSNYPLTVALAANDDLLLRATYGSELCAAADYGHTCNGIVMATNGILTRDYGWACVFGKARAKSKDTLSILGTTTTPRSIAICETGVVDIGVGTSTLMQAVIGSFVFPSTNDIATDLCWIQIAADEFAMVPFAVDIAIAAS